MNDVALVLNAGSSSLKFCVYERPVNGNWPVAARGQIEGIGISPRLQVKDADGELLEKRNVAASDGRAAVNELAAWLQSQFAGARVFGVGHRVVHGGPNFTGPT